MALLAAGFFLTRGGDDDGTTAAGGAGEIFLEAAAVQGPEPFTPNAATPPVVPVPTPDPAAPDTTVTLPPGTAPAIPATSAARPGLYGGTRNNKACDKAQLTGFLQQSPDKAAAFASVVGIAPTEVASYIAKLTPVILRGDTRVTNHGFANGKATPRQAVLQAGTAVLADDRGVPRVRCACGNPLAPPTAVQSRPTYTGKAWPGFSPTNVDVVAASPQPLSALVLSDPVTNTSFVRPVGSDGTTDGPAGPPVPDPTSSPTATTTAVTASSTTIRATTTTDDTINVPKPNVDATTEGTVSASSTFSPEFAASMAVDSDATTSWFSNAETTSTFTWTGKRNDLITEIRILGNDFHKDPKLRQGTGFGSVLIEVLDEFGDPDFDEVVQLPGSPDPDIVVRPGVEGRTVRLTFKGHEDPSRGGFSELKVGVTR